MKNLSNGARKDMLIVTFTHSLLKTAENTKQEGIVALKKNEQFIKKYTQEFRRTLSGIFDLQVSDEDKNYLRKKLFSKILPLLQKIGKLQVELNSFALFMVYVNFLDNRNIKIDEVFKPIIGLESTLFETLDLITDALEQEPEAMYNLAYECVSFLKA